ncbi:MAG: 3-deoxy-D-manno-octulosonic acid transferase [Akkermansiaceae bacterium]|nr:3-deoxy-D-manno-octulosonic acid transferase [Akkermansiaceae bacterium]NNM31152.1 3-deoxy-D-manno-octulosonic acid transferase [Akkermansiaceae bacterium]
MARGLVLAVYNLLLPLVTVLAAPGWLRRMARRGGWGPKLRERLGIYDRAPEFEPGGGIYVHAVSVGEVLLALKLVAAWREYDPDEGFVLACTTSTGLEVARNGAPQGVRVIYAPVDFPFLVRRVLRRFEPRLVVLVESELWPNLLGVAHRTGVPVALANARMSPRSERRYRRFLPVVNQFLPLVRWVGAQADEHAAVWRDLGVPGDRVEVTGSVKFDQEGVAPPKKRKEFDESLRSFGSGREVVLAASTHAGEEVLVARAVRRVAGALAVIVPRHAERRAEVAEALAGAGFEVCLRSRFTPPEDRDRAVLVADTTGELRDWTAHAGAVVVGKSFLARGGQNPADAIAAGIPVVTGPHMQNFEPLVSQLRTAGGIRTARDEAELAAALETVLRDAGTRGTMTTAARAVLERHRGATARTVDALRTLAGPRP